MLPCSKEASLSLDRLEKASAILQTIDNLQMHSSLSVHSSLQNNLQVHRPKKDPTLFH